MQTHSLSQHALPTLAPYMASNSSRARAYLTDFVIAALAIMTSLTLAELATPTSAAGTYGIWAMMAGLMIYEPVLVHTTGGTLGHRFRGLVVVDKNGDYLPLWKAVIRTLLKWLTIAWLSPFLVRQSRRQALWDLAVGSMVCERALLAAHTSGAVIGRAGASSH